MRNETGITIAIGEHSTTRHAAEFPDIFSRIHCRHPRRRERRADIQRLYSCMRIWRAEHCHVQLTFKMDVIRELAVTGNQPGIFLPRNRLADTKQNQPTTT